MEKPYYVIDFFSKQNLYYYMKIKDDGFSEKHAKVIFKKILEAIKYCHDRNICHLDIKPGNIMLDNKFEPVIIDFGFATEIRDQNKNIKKLDKFWGTKQYKCPEIWEEKEYSGEKADIFSLGVVLFNLVIGRYGFVTSTKYDPYYNLIIEGEENGTYENYWNKILCAINKENKLLSENFKNLYLEMVAYNPEKRPTIDKILNKSKWFDEINILNGEYKKNLDIEVKNELINIYNEKIKNISDDPNDTTVPDKDKLIIAEDIIPVGYQASRALDKEEEKIFYNNNLIPKKISQERLNLNLCIIIEGYIPGTKFMNTIYNKINSNEEITNNISFEASETDLKFRIDFIGNEKNYKDCSIDIELFEYKDNRYILEFLRKSGEISDYYKYFLVLKDIIQGKAIEKNKLEKNELEL